MKLDEQKKNGRLFLVPSFLGEDNAGILSGDALAQIQLLDCFVVENAKTARRFLRAVGYKKNFDTEVDMREMNKHTPQKPKELLTKIFEGHDVGIISEAGCPCIADPGNDLVHFAHAQKVEVHPLVGASSILLALIASGFNGQQFSFVGYLPIPTDERIKTLKKLEEQALRGHTQLFMEAPFRNNQLLRDVLEILQPTTQLCIACDITLSTQSIRKQCIADWRRQPPDLHKRYVVFVLGK